MISDAHDDRMGAANSPAQGSSQTTFGIEGALPEQQIHYRSQGFRRIGLNVDEVSTDPTGGKRRATTHAATDRKVDSDVQSLTFSASRMIR